MSKPICTTCNERPAFSKGLCSGCYGRQWRAQKALERREPKLIEGPIESGLPVPSSTHLVATDPVGMKEAQVDLKASLEQKLTVIENEIREANAALNEARRNGWSTGVLTSARNRLVDDETYYNKVLAAVEAGHTIIPEFPIDVFAIRRASLDDPTQYREGATWLSREAVPDCAPAGAGEFRSLPAAVESYSVENRAPNAAERGEPRWYRYFRRTGKPAGDIRFPKEAARSPLMAATAKAMEEKTFDQIGVCLPVANAGSQRRAVRQGRGDPLIIGQILRKSEGARQKCVSFIIGWYLNVNDL